MNDYHTITLPQESPEALRTAVQCLRDGHVIALPTDTVYGVAANPWQNEAVHRLYQVKERPLKMAIPLLVADIAVVPTIAAEISDAFRDLAERFWPGELTLIVPRQARVPDIITAGGSTVALRMPDHRFTLALCAELGGALAVTSANKSGSPACISAAAVYQDLGGRIPLIIDGGRSPGGVASTIVDCSVVPPVVLRCGNLSVDVLRRICPGIVLQ